MKQPIPTTQNDMILLDLIKGREITALQAVGNYGCLRLSARIADLKGHGHKITTTIQNKGRKHWAVYSMERSQRKRSKSIRGWA